VSSPIVFCTVCRHVMAVVQDGRGFPPDIAKRKLAKVCKNVRDHEAVIEYRAGIDEGLVQLLEKYREPDRV